MKKLFMFILLGSILFANCSKELQEYSCDPKVNEWVVVNRLKYANISRSEFHQFTLGQQLGLYRSFTGEEKVKLWNEKLNYLLATQKFSNEEKTYLIKLFKFVQPYHFDNVKGKEEFKEFSNKWDMDVRSKLGWDDKKIFLYTHILLTIEEWQIAADERSKSITAKSGSIKGVVPYPKDCECYYSIYCDTRSTCNDGNCNKVGGCGILGNSNCTGLCG